MKKLRSLVFQLNTASISPLNFCLILALISDFAGSASSFVLYEKVKKLSCVSPPLDSFNYLSRSVFFSLT